MLILNVPYSEKDEAKGILGKSFRSQMESHNKKMVC